MSEKACPCGSGESYPNCCEPICTGAVLAPTAEALMRSRYTAYATAQIEHIERTAHPSCRDEFDADSAREWAENSDWRGLEIIETHEGGADDESGTVEFIAEYAEQGIVKKHHEIATFLKHEGQWTFADGHAPKAKPFVRTEQKVGRNDPCPCGSGKKYKKCCLKG